MAPRVWRNGFSKALIVEKPHSTLDGYLAEMGIEPDRRDTPPESEDELIAWIQEGGHNLVFKRSRIDITRRVVESCPTLFGVMLCCIGDDSVDKQACADHGVVVTNDPISNGRSVVELVLGEMLVLSRRVFDAERDTEANIWTKSGDARYELKGKTLGVVGLGNIGKQVAQVCDAFGMDVVFYDTREVAVEVGETLGWHPCKSIEECFATSHVVTVHVSATDAVGNSNRNFLNYEHFAALSRDAELPGPRIFINAARGFIFEPDHLIRAVEEGRVQYAMVDVFPVEPKSKSDEWHNPYAGVDRIFATPHIGAATQEAQPRIARYVATTTRRLSHRGSLRNCVFSPRNPISLHESNGPKNVLSVVHSDTRGTKKAIDEAIYEAGLANLSSVHRDFPRYGIAYDLSMIDGVLSDEQIEGLIERARRDTGDDSAIRAVRMIEVGKC